MARRGAAVCAALTLAACGGGDEMRVAFNGLVSCNSTAVHVSFDPTSSVTVADGDATLARAGFGDQEVSRACEVTRRGFAPNATETTPYTDGGLPERGIYAAAEVDCRITAGVSIDVHPILNGDTGEYDGSNLLLLDGEAIVLSAILKSKGDPKASRIYHAPRYCTPA